jgi:hypothetical protein
MRRYAGGAQQEVGCAPPLTNYEDRAMKLSAPIAGVVIIFLLTWNPVTLAQQNAQTGFIFPFYATGTVFPNPLNALDFRTILYVTNPGALETKVTFEFRATSGELLARGGFAFDDNSVPALGSRKLVVSGFGSDAIQTGWIKVTASSPIFASGSVVLQTTLPVPPQATGDFTKNASAQISGDFIQAATNLEPALGFTEARISIEKRLGEVGLTGAAKTTGIALTFPRQTADQQPALGELRLLDQKGTEVGRQEISIPVNGQSAFLIEEIFSQLRETTPGSLGRDFFGALEVRFPNLSFPVYAKAVFVQSSGPLVYRDAGIVKTK